MQAGHWRRCVDCAARLLRLLELGARGRSLRNSRHRLGALGVLALLSQEFANRFRSLLRLHPAQRRGERGLLGRREVRDCPLNGRLILSVTRL